MCAEALETYTHFAVFSESDLMEQASPASHLISDQIASVSAIDFVDKDCDVAQLGGQYDKGVRNWIQYGNALEMIKTLVCERGQLKLALFLNIRSKFHQTWF